MIRKGYGPVKRLLRQSLALFEARQTGLLYGTNHTRIRFLPTAAWDRGVMDGFYGRGIYGRFLQLFGNQVVAAKKLSPVFFYQVDSTGRRQEMDGIISHVLRNCTDYYKKGISVILCPDTEKIEPRREKIYARVPFYVYNGSNIERSREAIRVDTRIVRQFKSRNSIYIYLPDYGILVINTARPDLMEIRDRKFVRKAALIRRLDSLIRMADQASLESLGLLSGKKGARLLWRKEKHLRALSRELADNEKKFRDLYQQAPVAYISMDIQGRILNANRQARVMSGYETEDLLGRYAGNFLVPSRAGDSPARDIGDMLLSGKPVLSVELKMKPARGDQIWVGISVDPIRDPRGRIIEFRAMITDISRRKSLEKQLFQSQKMETVGRVSGGIAHDFNNVLSPVAGYARLLKMGTDPGDPDQAYLDIILACSGRAKALVAQMLTFSRRRKTALKPVSMASIVQQSLVLIRSCLPATITLETRLDTADAQVFADPDQVGQMIVTLATRAFTAMEGGQGCLELALSLEDPGPSQPPWPAGTHGICLTLTDDGQAMDALTRERFFDPYFEAGSSEIELGMGLFVVYGIVQTHNGRIQVDSGPERGSRIRVFFPVSDHPAEKDAGSPARQKSEKSRLRKGTETILMVEDDKPVADMHALLLEKMGHEVKIFSNPEKAMDWLIRTADPVDLVITDQEMPSMTGRELALRVSRLRPGLPVILCSGFQAAPDDGLESGGRIAGYLQKPIDVDELSRLLERVLGPADT